MTGTVAAAPRSAATQIIGFKRHLRSEVVPGEAAFLFSERGVSALTGSLVEALAPLLDGTRDLRTLLEDLPAGIPAEQVLHVLGRLSDAGLVTTWAGTAPDGPDEPAVRGVAAHGALAYWDAGGIDATAAAAAAVTRARLRLLAVGDLPDTAVDTAAGALAAAGLRVDTVTAAGTSAATSAGTSADTGDGPADLSVVLCADYLAPGLAEVDAAHRAAGRPWLLAKPTGATVWIGPVFQPPNDACWHCMAFRLAAHRQPEGCVQAALGRQGPVPRPAVFVPPLLTMAMHLVALEAMKWVAGYRHRGQRGVWTFDSLDLVGQRHELRPRPQCPACGDPTLVRTGARQPLRLQPRRKASVAGGGHRSLTPDQILDRYRHLISPVTGVVKEIDRDRRGPAFFNSYRSGANLALGANSLRTLRSALRAQNGGKGTTALDAQVGALCEALERHCGTFHGDEERIRGSLRSLGEPAMHPNTCQLFHDRQYPGRVEWNAAHSPFQFVCAPFDERAVLDWTPVWSLTEGRHRLLPTNQLYFGAPVERGPRYVRADSNGNAAGGSLEDAVLQGLLEVVERDAVALWWYNRTKAPAVDLDAFGDRWVDELREVYASIGRDVWVLDVTSDLRIPTMVALSRQSAGPREAIMFGFGSHLDPQIALRRALTEMNQLVPAVIGAGSELAWGCDDDPDAANWFRTATVANQPYLLPDTTVPARGPADYEYEPRADLAEDVQAIHSRLNALGMELLVLDQTRPDIGLPVVKVIVPGMRHFWARLAPGRLYDVPVRLGRLAEPTPYEDLNPIPLFV